MGLQALAVGQLGGDRPKHLRSAFADLDQAAALDEVIHAQRRAEARRARGRQHMVRPGAVVAQALAGEGAEEDRTGMAQQRLPAVRIARADLQVLRRDAVADRAGLFHAARVDQRAAAFQRGADDLAPRHAGQQPFDGLAHRGDIGRIGAQQDALRELVVLGLAEQVHRHPVGRRTAVGQHQDLAGSGDHVDAHLAEHMLLGAGHVGIARAGDLVDARHALRAIGQRGHGLRAADGEGSADAGHRRRGQHQVVALAAAGVGTTMMISATPATCAGTAFMIRLDG